MIKLRSNRYELNYSILSRFYSGDNFKLVEVHTSTGYRNHSNNTYYRDGRLLSHKDLDFANSTEISLGFGKGRIDNVTDAVQAIFVLQDLQALYSTSYSQNQIEEIAKGITLIRNARYLDYRIRYKTQLKMLDSVLQVNGVGSERSVDYFTTISDNWLYANRTSRNAGSVWTHYATLANSFDHSGYIHESELNLPVFQYDRSSDLRPSISLNSSYSFATQKSLYVEKSWGIQAKTELRYLAIKSLTSSSSVPLDVDSFLQSAKVMEWDQRFIWRTNISGNWGYLFQPNTRNLWTIKVLPSIDFSKVLPKLTDNDLVVDGYILAPNLVASTYYYHWFSPQLHLNIRADIGTDNRYDKTERDELTDWRQLTNLNYDFSASLVYQFY
jgi:hypothetical protein